MSLMVGCCCVFRVGSSSTAQVKLLLVTATIKLRLELIDVCAACQMSAEKYIFLLAYSVEETRSK